ncbi:MAG: hydroxymethylglutaryl-CoA synthase [Kiritimatiellae bacterium]|nr:hydroxymethylglutaryl-CoA synthase [Kiritimatiellia bacterium]
MKAGIESISFYAPHYFVDLRTLARRRGADPDKFLKGLGQEKMGVPPPDEDIVTMGANAARQALTGVDPATIDTLLFATESGIDQSKAAGIYVHHLLGLPSRCKAYELKQACCSSTAGVLAALALVRQEPHKRALVVASDVARYGLGTPGEPTQGAGAVALVISATPKLVALDIEHGSYTEDVMDFWRPNYREEALVDGKYSIKVYLRALSEAWRDYVRQTGRRFEDHARFCYHLPFTRMAEKAHLHLAKLTGHGEEPYETLMAQIESSLRYNRVVGNSYTASLYIGLASLLEGERDLDGQRLGIFSYGSGCMAAYLSGVVQKGYTAHLHADHHKRMLDERVELSFEEYAALYEHHLPTDGSAYETARHETGFFRLAGLNEHKRIYEKIERADSEPAHAEAERKAIAGHLA